MKLTKEQISDIAKLSMDFTIDEVALQYQVSRSTIKYWVKRLKQAGKKIHWKSGVKKLKL